MFVFLCIQQLTAAVSFKSTIFYPVIYWCSTFNSKHIRKSRVSSLFSLSLPLFSIPLSECPPQPEKSSYDKFSGDLFRKWLLRDWFQTCIKTRISRKKEENIYVRPFLKEGAKYFPCKRGLKRRLTFPCWCRRFLGRKIHFFP